jgi:hypothetical protein
MWRRWISGLGISVCERYRSWFIKKSIKKNQLYIVFSCGEMQYKRWQGETNPPEVLFVTCNVKEGGVRLASLIKRNYEVRRV